MKDKILIIVFVLILGAFSAGVLTSMNYYTKQKVEKNNEIKIKSSILDAFSLEYSKDDVENIFNNNVKITTKSGITYYSSLTNEVAFEFSGSGLWGPISGIIALKEDLETIMGITIIHQEETPGLGGVIATKEYLDKFKNKKIIPKINIITAGKGTSNDNEVDAITGATMTSRAFAELLNIDILKFKEKYYE